MVTAIFKRTIIDWDTVQFQKAMDTQTEVNPHLFRLWKLRPKLWGNLIYA